MKKYFLLPLLLLLGLLAGCNKVNVDSDYVSVEGVTLDQESAYLVIGTTMTLKATVLPAKASKKEVEWKSSNPSVASVEDGLVTAHALGTADITVTSVSGGYEASCAITVVEKPIPVTGVTLSPADVTIKKGGTATLSAKLQPSNATNHNLKWTSSNESAVSVKDGVVTGVDYGTSTITVETVDGGFKATMA